MMYSLWTTYFSSCILCFTTTIVIHIERKKTIQFKHKSQKLTKETYLFPYLFWKLLAIQFFVDLECKLHSTYIFSYMWCPFAGECHALISLNPLFSTKACLEVGMVISSCKHIFSSKLSKCKREHNLPWLSRTNLHYITPLKSEL